ncbi:MAG: class I SAM-dependent methyltransferase [Planctomycetes bacterium]|nr:class I SAM-dependent methyltransferase [Planctomycetota bacterium]
MIKDWQKKLMHKYYYGQAGWVDGTSRFHRLIKQFAPSSAKILEIGAGPTNPTTGFLRSLGTVTGIDVDTAVRNNQYCETALVYDGVHIPCDNNSYDLVVSNYVCEHLENPLQVCREIYRVTRPRGHYIFRAPNLWHYVSLAAKFSPQWFHKLIANKLRDLPKEAYDPYLTYHRMNTKKVCSKILSQTNFKIEIIKMIESEPSYGMASPFLFYPLMMSERLLNSSSIFENFRANILCVASADKQQDMPS